MKNLLRRFVPAFALDWYHRSLAYLSAWLYGHPSEKLIVIGVTGTNGKTTTVNLIADVLEASGAKVGLTSTANFSIAGREWLNDAKMTMLGRFRLQKLLAEMVAAGCRYAVIETSSEGIKQHRHAAINYDVVVFTNLTPEHLESHGGFENYRAAKGELFAKIGRDRMKRIDGRKIAKLAVVNMRDANAGYFLEHAAGAIKAGFIAELPLPQGGVAKSVTPVDGMTSVTVAREIELTAAGSFFTVDGVRFRMKLVGGFNVENALAAVAVGRCQGVSLEQMVEAIAKVNGVPGRMEFVDAGQPFGILVDYAPEPESLRKLYEVVRLLEHRRIIHVLGSCGGGRDRDRRPVLGRLAAENADIVIVTNEDPYDDDPMTIIREVAAGAAADGKKEGDNLFVIQDRGEALDRAVALAEPGDLVIVTGKGAEQAICVGSGRKIPWDERARLREAVAKRLASQSQPT
ncbi:MAG: UDP-N-acetylmuramoyl-L-alanyl-D-glutamate--2,6-diaminopimelate ligase [Patescibacteria group bacterium]|nr:UDP-N-acetylmuramoyl-L-alanyl-D-glutamate--2,6-diaminopimelate ligase [Patescibacteria group bacterium]